MADSATTFVDERCEPASLGSSPPPALSTAVGPDDASRILAACRVSLKGGFVAGFGWLAVMGLE